MDSLVAILVVLAALIVAVGVVWKVSRNQNDGTRTEDRFDESAALAAFENKRRSRRYLTEDEQRARAEEVAIYHQRIDARRDYDSNPSAPLLGDWRDAENGVARWLKDLGEREVAIGRGSKDGGVDVETERLVVQVKHWKNRATAPSVRQIYGVARLNGKTAVVVARNGFTPDAVAFAEKAGVALFEYASSSVNPFNQAAEHLFTRPSH